MSNTLASLRGTRWTGRGELWLDPLGYETIWCDCQLEVRDDGVHYTWSYEGQPKQGTFTLTPSGAHWVDTWHAEKGMTCTAYRVPGALFALECSYGPPEGPPWGWRSVLSLRPEEGELVLQMTNVAPWGEDARAVRMIFQRA